MTDSQILAIALNQSAIDCNCKPEDFLASENKITLSKADPRARKYLPLPFACDLVSYGSNVVAQVRDETRKAVCAYLAKYSPAHCFETPNIHKLDELLAPFGLKTCFMAEYFLPSMNQLRPIPCDYELRELTPADFAPLYQASWSNALCEKRKELDVMAVGAYDKGRLIALAGASADCETMYQIGVDILPEYRRRGIASALTSRLTQRILEEGKVPFYCAAWSNLPSVRNALRCGYRPAWVELTARERDFVKEMNQ